MGSLASRMAFAIAPMVLLLVATGARAADDCRADDASIISFRSLIDDADTIVLAKAISAEPLFFGKDGVLNFIFEVTETLKGYQRRPLKIKAAMSEPQDDGSERRDLDSHRRMGFWDRMETRLVHVSSCLQELSFKPGETYLLIDPEEKPSSMSVRFELIDDVEEDLWLASVRKMIEEPSSAARSMSIDQYFRAQQSVAFAVMPYCNEKLRAGASRVVDISEPLHGTRVDRDGIHPDIFADALEGCDGFTALLGIFYQPDQSRPKDAPLGSTVYPGQRYLRLEGEVVPIGQLRTEIEIVGPSRVALPELVAALKD